MCIHLSDSYRHLNPSIFLQCTSYHLSHSIPTLSTSHFVNSHFVNSHLVNVDKVGIDKVGIDKVGIDEVGVDKVGIDKVGRSPQVGEPASP